MAEFIIQSGKHQGKRLTIPNGEVCIGRDEDCQIRAPSSDISRRHCLLHVDADGVSVRDLGSRNGTFINDAPVTGDTRLQPGDVLRVGPMVFQVPPQPAATAHPDGRRASGVAAPTAAPATADPAGAAAPGAKRGKKRASEDEIANWLSDEDETGELPASGDTTIISGPKKKTPDAPFVPVTPVIPRAEKKAFQTVAAEAADIIRRHWESARMKKS